VLTVPCVSGRRLGKVEWGYIKVRTKVCPRTRVDFGGAVDVLEGKRDAEHLAAIVARHGIGFWTPLPAQSLIGGNHQIGIESRIDHARAAENGLGQRQEPLGQTGSDGGV
jgi:hypothetical protein